MASFCVGRILRVNTQCKIALIAATAEVFIFFYFLYFLFFNFFNFDLFCFVLLYFVLFFAVDWFIWKRRLLYHYHLNCEMRNSRWSEKKKVINNQFLFIVNTDKFVTLFEASQEKCWTIIKLTILVWQVWQNVGITTVLGFNCFTFCHKTYWQTKSNISSLPHLKVRIRFKTYVKS